MGFVTILALNAGSSSLKFALFEEEKECLRGAIEGIGEEEGLFWAGETEEKGSYPNHHVASKHVLAWLKKEKLTPFAIGHRLVHGGERFIQPELLTDDVLDYLHSLIPFAPLHLERELAVIKAIEGLPQVGCFDTAFHAAMPEKAKRFPLPASFWEAGIRRYGFHGLSYSYIMEVAPIQERMVIAHLGNGASLAAIKGGKCVDTTMGFTPTGGVVMGTRPGDLDPGLLLYCMREKKMGIKEIEKLVDHQSGLLGISETTSDMKHLLQIRAEDRRAKLAVEMFTTGIAKGIGSYAALLGGLDLLIFTGGIGERSEVIRSEILAYLGYLNCEVLTIPTNEQQVIARSVNQLCKVH